MPAVFGAGLYHDAALRSEEFFRLPRERTGAHTSGGERRKKFCEKILRHSRTVARSRAYVVNRRDLTRDLFKHGSLQFVVKLPSLQQLFRPTAAQHNGRDASQGDADFAQSLAIGFGEA